MKKVTRKNNNFYLALVISVFLHLLFFSLYGTMKEVLLLTPAATAAAQPQGEEEKRLEFELVETPDDAASDRTPENTNLVSDKNAVARDKYTGTDLADGDPFSEGQTEYKTFAGAIAPPSPPPQPITVPENAAEKQAEKTAENEAEKKEVAFV